MYKIATLVTSCLLKLIKFILSKNSNHLILNVILMSIDYFNFKYLLLKLIKLAVIYLI